jgi:hypothetical protein
MSDVQDVECSFCHSVLDTDEQRVMADGDIVCAECTLYCESCSTLMPNDDALCNDNHVYCSDCATRCGNCSEVEHDDNVHRIGRELWCEGCYENHTFYCESCSESYPEYWNNYYVEESTYCESCYESECYYCDDCDEYRVNGNDCECDGISGSARQPCGCRGFIHNYSCKPNLEFKGTSRKGVYMGFELEMEIRGSSDDLQEAARFASNALLPIAILKSDASIGRDGYSGFELVTQPHSHTEYRDNSALLWNTIETLRTSHKARSWDTNTCGLHIHVSRAGFSSGAHMHRFIAFIYHNSEMMMKFAGRKTDFARFNDVYKFDEYDKPVMSFKHKVGNPRNNSTERYSAVNTQNRDTLELRFFRGTMNPSGVLSALDLTQAVVEYTRELRLDDVKLGALTWDWFADYVRDNNGLYPDLYSRLPKIASVSITNRQLQEA